MRSDPLLTRHLDHGYMYGWNAYMPAPGGPVDRPYPVEVMHSSLQCYPPLFLRPHHWREIVPGCSTAIHVRTGMLVLRIFHPPAPEYIRDRYDYFQASDAIERNKSTCFLVELFPGEMMCVCARYLL